VTIEQKNTKTKISNILNSDSTQQNYEYKRNFCFRAVKSRKNLLKIKEKSIKNEEKYLHLFCCVTCLDFAVFINSHEATEFPNDYQLQITCNWFAKFQAGF